MSLSAASEDNVGSRRVKVQQSRQHSAWSGEGIIFSIGRNASDRPTSHPNLFKWSHRNSCLLVNTFSNCPPVLPALTGKHTPFIPPSYWHCFWQSISCKNAHNSLHSLPLFDKAFWSVQFSFIAVVLNYLESQGAVQTEHLLILIIITEWAALPANSGPVGSWLVLGAGSEFSVKWFALYYHWSYINTLQDRASYYCFTTVIGACQC